MLSDESAVKVSDMDIEVSTATAKALFDWAVENALFIHANHQPPKYFKQSYIECLLRLALHFGGDHESVGLTVYLSKAYNIFLQNESNAKNTQDIIKKYLPARGSKQDRILTGEKSKRVRTVKDTYNVVSDRLKKLELRSDFAAKRFPLSGKSWKQVLVILKIVNLNVLGSKNKHTVVSANSSNIQPFNSEEFLCITRHAKYDNVFAAKYKYGGKDFVIKFTDNENDERRELELSTKYNICDCIVVANRVYDVSQEDLCNVFGMSKEEALNFRHGNIYDIDMRDRIYAIPLTIRNSQIATCNRFSVSRLPCDSGSGIYAIGHDWS
ncbi:hypothetical protein BKA69DRAFT_1091294 [Paraphysoderma sedebokerense]|nr:hypothetical protein BKA69DRAFT_1107410 [Paraphysoderma sedebokerense]KAI9138456.1 hypothetical protein BKA69DRAFT_1091294 [Paraphysoderma sedebokerense]